MDIHLMAYQLPSLILAYQIIMYFAWLWDSLIMLWNGILVCVHWRKALLWPVWHEKNNTRNLNMKEIQYPINTTLWCGMRKKYIKNKYWSSKSIFMGHSTPFADTNPLFTLTLEPTKYNNYAIIVNRINQWCKWRCIKKFTQAKNGWTQKLKL